MIQQIPASGEGHMGRKSNNLNVVKIMEDFRKAEETPSRRAGTFKINASFEKALDTILKSKSESKKL
jgi:hypothetical protein